MYFAISSPLILHTEASEQSNSASFILSASISTFSPAPKNIINTKIITVYIKAVRYCNALFSLFKIFLGSNIFFIIFMFIFYLINI